MSSTMPCPETPPAAGGRCTVPASRPNTGAVDESNQPQIRAAGGAVRPRHASALAPTSLAAFAALARNQYPARSPAERRVQAAEDARETLNEALGLPLTDMTRDEVVLAFLKLRSSLAGLLTEAIPAATPPSHPDVPDPEGEEVVASLLDVISGAASVHADIAVDLDQPLPADLINVLARAVNAPGVTTEGRLRIAVGDCGSARVLVRAECSDEDAS